MRMIGPACAIIRRVAIAIVLLVSTTMPAAAQNGDYRIETPNWEDPENGLPAPVHARIGVPRNAGQLMLRRLGEFSDGTGLDNFASYSHSDGDIFATVYIYRTGLSNAGLLALVTTNIIETLYEGATLTENGLAEVGDRGPVARFSVYENAIVRDIESTSVAGFFRAGPWMIKLRVTGPQQRRDEIVASARTLLSELVVPEELAVVETAIYDPTPCPAGAEVSARLLETGDPSGADPGALAAAILVAGQQLSGGELDDIAPPDLRPCIVAEAVSAEAVWMVFGDRNRGGAIAAALFGDSGQGAQILPSLAEEFPGVHVALHRGAGTLIFGPFDHAPSVAQLRSLTGEGSSGWTGEAVSSVTVDGEGNSSITLHSSVVPENIQ